MTCQRCDGLMVREQYDNLEFDSAGYEISGWRCLNCGAIVDALIETPGPPPIILTAPEGGRMKQSGEGQSARSVREGDEGRNSSKIYNNR